MHIFTHRYLLNLTELGCQCSTDAWPAFDTGHIKTKKFKIVQLPLPEKKIKMNLEKSN